MYTLLLLPALLILACSVDAQAPRSSTVINTSAVRASVDSTEQAEYVIADTIIDGHHIRIDRYTCSIRVRRDSAQATIEWPEYERVDQATVDALGYNPNCEGDGYQGMLVVDDENVSKADIVATGRDNFYFGAIYPTCRGEIALVRCISLPNGQLSCYTEDSYWSWIVLDPERRLWLRRNSLHDIEWPTGNDSTATEEYISVFNVFRLGEPSQTRYPALPSIRLYDTDPLFDAGYDDEPTASQALALHRRFMR